MNSNKKIRLVLGLMEVAMDIFERDLTGEPVSIYDPEFYKINEVIKNTQRLLAELNNFYHTRKEIQELFSRLTGKQVDSSFELLAPFYTDFGRDVYKRQIMGSKLDVRPIWIIFAVTVGGGLFGVVGMLLSVPAMMVIRMLLSELMSNIEEKRSQNDQG